MYIQELFLLHLFYCKYSLFHSDHPTQAYPPVDSPFSLKNIRQMVNHKVNHQDMTDIYHKRSLKQGKLTLGSLISNKVEEKKVGRNGIWTKHDTSHKTKHEWCCQSVLMIVTETGSHAKSRRPVHVVPIGKWNSTIDINYDPSNVQVVYISIGYCHLVCVSIWFWFTLRLLTHILWV